MDLSQLVTTRPYPTSLGQVLRSFARQPDCQTCGASAVRHGLLLGGLSLSTSILEAVLAIRQNEGTSPEAMRACLSQLGLEPKEVRKPKRWSTQAFLNRFADDFAQGAFLIPCILTAEHWVLLGDWNGKRVGLVDSFFDGKPRREWNLSPGLGFFKLSVEELDALDWAHHVTLVRPGRWAKQYRAWLPARSALLRLNGPTPTGSVRRTLAQMLRLGVHQFLDDADYAYRSLNLHLPRGAAIHLRADDPGEEPVAMETHGTGAEEVVVMRRLGPVLRPLPAAPEVVLRGGAIDATQLAG
ncbi:MAG: hypothetical protein EBV06_01445 [Planctomycetia bacterium]|nr:hypothetical protein [Planctomycetia bacterium]